MTSASGVALTRDEILAQARALPAAPQILGGLCELLQDINTDLDQIADEIRMDPALAGRVIRLSNSVYFGGSGTASIEAAVNRVGFTEIIRMVGVATVAGLVERSLRFYGVEAERLRESLLLHALASEALAGYTALAPRAAYAGGLLRGVGMMVLDHSARGRLDPRETFVASGLESYADWERARFGLTGVEVATMVLDEWRFPSELLVAIEQHHAPAADPLAHILNLGGAIVAARGLALPGEEACWALTPEKLAGAGIDETHWQAACAQAHALFDHQRNSLY